MHSLPTPSPAGDNLHFDSTDLGATEDFLVRAYTKMTIAAGEGESPSARVDRRWLGSISFDELELDFHMSYDAAPLGRVCLCRVHDGRIEENFVGEGQDVFEPGDVTLLSHPEMPYSGRVCQANYDLTMFDTALLDRVAAPAEGQSGGVRLVGHRAVNAQAERQLDHAIEYVRTIVHSEGGTPSRLVASTTESMLAAVVINTLPTNAAVETTARDRVDAKPPLLRRAIAFIESNADSDIALADIAASIHVTPRALQYMFRRHAGMTPMEYLRRVRMDHAHHELMQSDPGSTTIQLVASRWGFGHTGRFASLYRKTYGCNPSDTLRG
ncbi:AraC-like DNA-binding protein [Mycolicibacterium iranicum]|uniref:AraC-like DNA-binding protein n=1 Tax=Mycolicibacterium iranicum TaxID=912594 RepID=A0A839Q6U5_MYCIR|nr:helix-turn-helix transcriptional regulator [Mycolicibacterium iranicum]MBB2988912.1 AraC-like DNA-binding protein [Mycolicibacterium iranicum]